MDFINCFLQLYPYTFTKRTQFQIVISLIIYSIDKLDATQVNKTVEYNENVEQIKANWPYVWIMYF